MEFVALVPEIVFGDELDLAGAVVLLALGAVENGELAPERVVKVVLDLAGEGDGALVGVGGLEEVVEEAEKVGAVSRPHQERGGLGPGSSVVEGHAAGGIALPAILAGADRFLAHSRDFFAGAVHGGRLP